MHVTNLISRQVDQIQQRQIHERQRLQDGDLVVVQVESEKLLKAANRRRGHGLQTVSAQVERLNAVFDVVEDRLLNVADLVVGEVQVVQLKEVT